jgi:c-di-AMP phosphodiesterase-like protein
MRAARVVRRCCRAAGADCPRPAPAETLAVKDVAAEPCRPAGDAVICFVQIDNLEDVLQGLDETQRNALQSETHQHLLAWAGRLNGFLRKHSEDTYMGFFSRPDLDRMIGEKFDILDEVRALRVGNKIPVTLSMGIAANGATMSERGQKAQTGLDLALGRGGDQAAVYVNDEVQFYGGKAKVMEKSTRVKARVVAHAIRELMQEAGDVLVMGHEGEDFDSLGAAMRARMAAIWGSRSISWSGRWPCRSPSCRSCCRTTRNTRACF